MDRDGREMTFTHFQIVVSRFEDVRTCTYRRTDIPLVGNTDRRANESRVKPTPANTWEKRTNHDTARLGARRSWRLEVKVVAGMVLATRRRIGDGVRARLIILASAICAFTTWYCR